MADKSVLDWIVLVLVIIGAINLGLLVFNFNLLVLIFGGVMWLLNLVYLLIGLSGLYLIYYVTKK